MLVLGDITGVIGGRTFHGFGRLNPDGSLDESFFPDAQGRFLLRDDGSIILVQGSNLVLLDATGHLVEQWPLPWAAGAEIDALLEIEPGQWLAGGRFMNYPLRRPNLIRFFFDPTPAFRLISGGIEDGTLVLNAQGPSGIKYSIEYCDALAKPVWTALTNGLSDGSLQHFRDSNLAGKQRFYRLRAE
jgi:hypothetical protein